MGSTASADGEHSGFYTGCSVATTDINLVAEHDGAKAWTSDTRYILGHDGAEIDVQERRFGGMLQGCRTTFCLDECSERHDAGSLSSAFEAAGHFKDIQRRQSRHIIHTSGWAHH